MLRTLPITMLVLAALAAQPASAQKMSSADSSTDDSATAADRQLYAVPTRFDRIGRIVAPVYINGLGPFRFMIDTGANRTVLSDEAVRRLGLPIEDGVIGVQGVNGHGIAPAVIVEHLDAGELRFDNVRLPVLAGTVLDRIDGILGMDGLAGKKVTADFVRDRISIVESKGRRAPANRIVLRGQLISGQLMMVAGYVGRVPVKAIIDTGGMHTLGNSALQRAVAARHARGGRGSNTSVVDATDQTVLGNTVISPLISLGKASIRNSAVICGDFDIFRVWGLNDEPALLIGMDILGTLAEVAIDYRRRELQLLTRGS